MKMNNNRRKFLKSGAFLAPFLLFGKGSDVLAREVAEPNTTIFDVFKSRRSIRKYKPTAVPQEHIEQILQAAASAPSAGNGQPWRFLVVQTPDLIQNLYKACIDRARDRINKDEGMSSEQVEKKLAKTKVYYDSIFAAPVFIVVLTDGNADHPKYHHWDGPLAAGYLFLAARALGYASVHFTDSISDEVTRKMLNIPERYTRVCITPIGIPQEWPDAPPKKKLEEMVSYNTL